jgi:hypothetical protein
MSFAPLNYYTFAAARGEFLRPDVRALLDSTPVGPFAGAAVRRGEIVRWEPDPRAEAVRKRLDALLFPNGLQSPTDT